MKAISSVGSQIDFPTTPRIRAKIIYEQPPGELSTATRAQLRPLLRCFSNGIQPALGFGIDVGGQRAAPRDLDVFPQVRRVQRADDGGMDVRMGEQKAQQEGCARFARAAQLVQVRRLELPPSLFAAETCAGLAPRHTTPVDDARAGL